MKISWLLLTMNRAEKVEQSFEHNMENCGIEHKNIEVVWVDNGSNPPLIGGFITSRVTSEKYVNVTYILGENDKYNLQGREAVEFNVNKQSSYAGNNFIVIKHVRSEVNLGVAKGYNIAMDLAQGDYIVITGCDMLMPDNWMKIMLEYMETIPNIGIISMYSKTLKSVPERLRGMFNPVNIKGLPVIPAMPIERRMFKRELLNDVGYLREDLGLYGWEDYCWAMTTERVCKEKGLNCYVIPHLQAQHLGTEGIDQFQDGGDAKEYWEFKQKEVNDPKKLEVIKWCQERNWPIYNPYTGQTDGPFEVKK